MQTFTKWTAHEINLNNKFRAAKDAVHSSLCGTRKIFSLSLSLSVCRTRAAGNTGHNVKLTFFYVDNIDTRSALDAIRDVISYCNLYIRQSENPNTLLLRDVAVYITKMLVIFGAVPSAHDAIGFPVDNERTANVR